MIRILDIEEASSCHVTSRWKSVPGIAVHRQEVSDLALVSTLDYSISVSDIRLLTLLDYLMRRVVT